MNWYRKSMALEPGMWQSDPNAHRLRRHHEVVKTPFGFSVNQPQDKDELSSLYKGVHLTDSFDNAAIYANNKSTQEDAPVVIEIYKDKLEALTDVDAEGMHQAFLDVLSEYKSKFDSVISDESLDSEGKVGTVISNLERNLDFGDSGGEIEDPIDSFTEQQRTPVERVIISYIERISDWDQKLIALSKLMEGDIPKALLIESVNQFRVMNPIESVQVKAIYRISRVNLDEFKNLYALREMDDEELEEEGVTRVGDDFFDEGMRLLVDYESLDYGSPFDQEIIYRNPDFRDIETTYHGTTYSRAKSAFPELLK